MPGQPGWGIRGYNGDWAPPNGEGYYHQAFNDPGRERVIAGLGSWLEKHV